MNDFIDIDEAKQQEYNAAVTHPLQSFEWGEFRKKTGLKVIRRARVKNKKLEDAFTLTLHRVPRTNFNIGYLPKSINPSKVLIEELKRIGQENNCIFVQLEPNVKASANMSPFKTLKKAAHPLFTKYTFVLDLTKSEEDLLAGMHPKTRYNIRVAQKHNVEIVEDNSEKSFQEYLDLMTETTNRQGFYAHTPKYHKILFETLQKGEDKNTLSYHLLNARLNGKTLTSWVLFVFKDTLYYPYGASSRENREVMANNLIAWEAIKFGKKLGLTRFDMWGALGANPDKRDPWYGFHHFKEGYGPEHVEFVGSYDLVIKPAEYQVYKVLDKLRWMFLKFKK